MTSTEDRIVLIRLIDCAVANGARQWKACEEAELCERTYERWKEQIGKSSEEGLTDLGLQQICHDKRPSSKHPEPANKLTEEEREQVLHTINEAEYRDLPPSQIVPALCDKGIYLCSESTMYRVMKDAKQCEHRGRSKKPTHHPKSTYCALAPKQVWTWDITYLMGAIKGMFYYLYLILDIFSRDIVGWEVWDEESADHAAKLIRRTMLAQGLRAKSSSWFCTATTAAQ